MWWLIESKYAFFKTILKAFIFSRLIWKAQLICSSALILLSANYLNTEGKIDTFDNSSSSCKQRFGKIDMQTYIIENIQVPQKITNIDCLYASEFNCKGENVIQ